MSMGRITLCHAALRLDLTTCALLVNSSVPSPVYLAWCGLVAGEADALASVNDALAVKIAGAEMSREGLVMAAEDARKEADEAQVRVGYMGVSRA